MDLKKFLLVSVAVVVQEVGLRPLGSWDFMFESLQGCVL
jgi:hypothetical protein